MSLFQRGLWLLALCVGAIVLRADVARAHAFIDHADPKVGATLTQSPPQVKVWFNEAIEPEFSKLQVLDANGNQVDAKDTHLEATDHALLIVSLPAALPAGEYKVVWNVVASDTHRTHGDFKFTVKP